MIPEYFRSEEEHKKPFSDPDSLVYKSGLELVSFGEFRATTLREYRHRNLGKITPGNIEGNVTDSIHIFYHNQE